MAHLLRAESAEDLGYKLALIDIQVAPRSAGRTTEQTERFSIAHLLSSLPKDRLAFPLTVEHGDRPDCVVTFNEGSIGIELTETVPENVARASALRQSGLGPQCYFIPRALRGEPPRSTVELRREITFDKAGPPWVGDAPEREWANAMLHFAAVKVDKAHKPGFVLHPRNWLLIYDNWPLPAVRRAEASSILAGHCAAAGIFNTFDRVFVLSSNVLCEIYERVELHQVFNPSAAK